MKHQHKFNMDYIIFWSSLFAVLILSHKTNGILTESNDIHCTDIQCPTKCPEDSYLKSTMDMEEDEFIDFEDEFISHFEELTPLVESHEEHPEHTVKERQKREVFFHDDIESCCGDQKCVCNECPDVPKCFMGYVAVRIHEGKGEPGNCCSQYRCLKKVECQMGVKQTWWTGKCTNCSCFGETEFCEQICREEEVVQNCYSEYLQKPLINGAIWQEGPCTKCTCEQGERRCFASICPKLDCKHTVTYEDVCCPKCVGDETDERMEIVHIQEMEEVKEETNTETIELSINNELNSTEVLENTSTEVIILSDNFTSTPLVESVETNTSASSQELTSTSPNSLESKIDEQFLDTTSSTETSIATSTSTLASSSVEEDVSLKYEHITSTISSSSFSDELLDSTMKSLLGFNEDVTSSTTSTTAEQPKSEEISTAVSRTTEVTASTTISAIQSSLEPNEETTTQISLENSSSTEVDLSTVSIMTSDVPITATSNITPLENVSTGISSSTTAALESTTAALESTTAALESTTASSSSTEISPSTTTDNISFSQMSSTLSTNTTETPMDPTTTDSSSSTTTTTTTSTTSSPYSSALETSSVSPVKQLLEESSTTSTTSAPEPLMPLYQLYGEFNNDERISSTNTQNQMRIMFDEIDYMVMISLFVGSLMCIALGLIIRHAKNRKKMYSSVPNSETSLSQTSTVMTV